MRYDRLQTFARAVGGLVLGVAVWWGLAEPYNQLLSGATEPLVRAFEDPPATRLHPRGAEMTIDRSDFSRSDPFRPGLATRELTVNFVLLIALFSANRKPLATRNVGGFLIAAGLLTFVHVLAIITNIQSIYALNLGRWSTQHYGIIARNFWGAAAHFYVLIGGFASAFLLWWLLRPSRSNKTGT